MPTPPFSPEKVREIQRLAKEGLDNSEIGRQLNLYRGTVAKHRGPYEAKAKEKQPTAKDLANRQIDDYADFHREKFLELQERFRKWVGDTSAVYKKPEKYTHGTQKPNSRTAQKPNKYLVANDLHAPFIDERAFGQAIREAKEKGAEEAIIPGDIFDLFGVSRYPKTRKKFSLVEEFQGGRAALRTLSENFRKVYLMRGNHDERWLKYLVSMNIPPDVLDFFRIEYQHSLDPVAKIAADFPNVEMLDVPSRGNATYSHIAQMGDVVFSHSEKFSIIAGKATADVNLYCQKKYLPMGIIKPYKVLIQAHTHGAARFYGDFGVLCIENGCLAQIPDYDGSPRLMGREPILGYTILVQENGITDQNATHFYRVG